MLERLAREGVDAALAERTVRSIESSPRHLPGIARAWLDLDARTPDVLAARFGDETIVATVDRDDDPEYTRTLRRRSRPMPLRALLDRMRRGPSSDVSLVAQSQALRDTALGAHLGATLRLTAPGAQARGAPGAATAPPRPRPRASLWMGPAGTITPFHHDPSTSWRCRSTAGSAGG